MRRVSELNALLEDSRRSGKKKLKEVVLVNAFQGHEYAKLGKNAEKRLGEVLDPIYILLESNNYSTSVLVGLIGSDGASTDVVAVVQGVEQRLVLDKEEKSSMRKCKSAMDRCVGNGHSCIGMDEVFFLKYQRAKRVRKSKHKKNKKA